MIGEYTHHTKPDDLQLLDVYVWGHGEDGKLGLGDDTR